LQHLTAAAKNGTNTAKNGKMKQVDKAKQKVFFMKMAWWREFHLKSAK